MTRSFRTNKGEIISFGDTQTVSQATVPFPSSPNPTPFLGIFTGWYLLFCFSLVSHVVPAELISPAAARLALFKGTAKGAVLCPQRKWEFFPTAPKVPVATYWQGHTCCLVLRSVQPRWGLSETTQCPLNS